MQPLPRIAWHWIRLYLSTALRNGYKRRFYKRRFCCLLLHHPGLRRADGVRTAQTRQGAPALIRTMQNDKCRARAKSGPLMAIMTLLRLVC